MYAGGRAAQLGQQFRYQAFVSGYHFGFDCPLPARPYPGGERFSHPIQYGPEASAAAPFPHRAGTSFVDALVMSSRAASSGPNLRFRGLKPKIFADGESSKFSLMRPDLSTIVEESVEDCGFPDDPG
eukprot:3931682-Rhodomonas_salina.1